MKKRILSVLLLTFLLVSLLPTTALLVKLTTCVKHGHNDFEG